MKILTTPLEMRSACRLTRLSPSVTLGLVPTMGALHAGHLSLVRRARQTCDVVTVSIFVNPTQFGPNEDLARYPRTFEADCAALETEGVDLLFAPSPAEMYPSGRGGTFIEVPEISNRLDGASRPGHFRGVATVVSKLLNIISPDHAFFGQKDAAQVAVLKSMVRDLDIGVTIEICPTVRDPDGLALSSRNRFLSLAQRTTALAIPRALDLAATTVRTGERRAEALEATLRDHLAQTPGLRIDYVAVVNRNILLPQSVAGQDTLLAVAAWVGDTRLIDNLPLDTLIRETVNDEASR